MLGRSCCASPRPGVPDIYQGDELWDLSLVDPDNRSRGRLAGARREALAALRDGAPVTRDNAKLFTVTRLLELRRRRLSAFSGAYVPLEAGTTTCAYARGTDVVVVVPVRADPVDVRLPPGDWHNVLAELAGPYGDDRLAVLERVAR